MGEACVRVRCSVDKVRPSFSQKRWSVCCLQSTQEEEGPKELAADFCELLFLIASSFNSNGQRNQSSSI